MRVLLWLLVVASPVWAQSFEPNQTRRTAARLEPGDHQGIIGDGEDWFLLEVPDDARAEVALRHLPEDRLEVELYDARGRRCGWGGEVDVASLEGVEVVFVRVFGAPAVYDLHAGLGPRGGRGWGRDFRLLTLEPEATTVVRCDSPEAPLQLTVFDEDEALAQAGWDEGATTLPAAAGREEEGGATELVLETDRPKTVVLCVEHPTAQPSAYTLEVEHQRARADLDEVLGVARPSDGWDHVILDDLTTLRGRVLDARLDLHTPYGAAALRVDRLAAIDMENSRDCAVGVDGTRLHGVLGARVFEVELDGHPIEIPRARVQRIVFAPRGGEREGLRPSHCLTTYAVDALAGTWEGAAEARVSLGFTQSALPDDLELLQADLQGGVVATCAGGRLLRGQLANPWITFRPTLAPDSVLTLHVRQLEALSGPETRAAVVAHTHGDPLRLRGEPHLQAAVYDRLAPGTSVFVLERLETGWCRVWIHGCEAWAFGDYLE